MRRMLRTTTVTGFIALALAAFGTALPARAADAPLCIYDGNSFSEGAHICAQASLMMTCSVAGDRAVWKVVTDRDISRLCIRPSRADTTTTMRSRRHVARHHASSNVSPQIGPPAAGSAKCFTFNGKRYCE
jgi:hypothetical protein